MPSNCPFEIHPKGTDGDKQDNPRDVEEHYGNETDEQVFSLIRKTQLWPLHRRDVTAVTSRFENAAIVKALLMTLLVSSLLVPPTAQATSYRMMEDDQGDNSAANCVTSFFPEVLLQAKKSSSQIRRQSPTTFDEQFLQKIRKESTKERCYDPALLTEECSCWSPLIASPPPDDAFVSWREKWPRAWHENQKLIQQALQLQADNVSFLDVVMLGDSITEQWNGMRLGKLSVELKGNRDVFQELFQNETQGLALGIGGDRCPQLLYRLQNGILGLRPRVWWILIGTNDILGGQCSINQVVACNMNIAREILRLQPQAKIVINSLLPVAHRRSDSVAPFWSVKFWESVYRPTNRKLECFAATQDRIEFCNVTDVFLTENGIIDAALLPDGIHPGELGSRLWGRVIVERVKGIIKEDD